MKKIRKEQERMRKCYKRWSETDLKILKQYSKDGINVVRKKLPERTETAIRTKCAYMNLALGDVYEVKERFYMVV